MKVVFICPKVPYFYSRTPYIPLGIAYLAASIKDSVDIIEYIDGQILRDEEYEQAVAKLNADVICISATLLQMKESYRISCLIKMRLPLSKVIIGGYGPHSVKLQELFSRGGFDIFVYGEGELTLQLVLDCLKRDGNLKEIPGIVFVKSGKLMQGKPNSELPEMNSLPRPLRELFNVPLYLRMWRQNTGITSLHMITSRGCPFGCIFCDKSVTGRTYRCQDPKLVAVEMEGIWRQYGSDDIFLFDDLFTLRREHVLAVCQEIKYRRLSLKWSAQGRVGIVDLEVLSAMKEAGCTELLFGVESGSNKILSFLEKGFTRQEIIESFTACQEVGLPAGVYLIVGVPGETKEDVDATINLIRKIRPCMLNFSFLTPFPNTELHQKTSQWIDEEDWTKWDDFTKTVYNYPFEVDPRISRQRIMDAYKELIEKGLDHSPYQLLE